MKTKFTFVDFFIVILALAIGSLLAVNIFGRQKTEMAANRVPHFANVTVESVFSKSLADNISVGDPLLDSDSGLLIGRVSKIEFTSYTVYHSGLASQIEYPDKVSARITFSTELGQNGDIPYGFETMPVIGERYRLSAPGLAFEGECISVSESDFQGENVMPPM